MQAKSQSVQSTPEPVATKSKPAEASALRKQLLEMIVRKEAARKEKPR